MCGSPSRATPRSYFEVECIEAELKDLGPAWSARSKPKHPGLESVEIDEASFTRKSAGGELDDEGA